MMRLLSWVSANFIVFRRLGGDLNQAKRSTMSANVASSVPVVQGVDVRRCRRLNTAPLKESTDPVIYWMSRDQRSVDNWALTYAQKLAIRQSAPLHVVFSLVPKFLDATLRQYDFLLKGLREVAVDLESKNIPFHLQLGKAGDKVPALVNELSAQMVVCDMSPLRVPSQWARDVADACHAKEGREPPPRSPLAGDAVAISFRVRGLTFETISRSKPTLKALKKAFRGALAAASGHGIGMEHVAVSLGEEPLVVDANIWPPPSVSCEAVEEKLRSCLSSLPDSIQSWIAQIPNLPDLAGSAVKVSKSSLTMSIIRSDDDEVDQVREDAEHFEEEGGRDRVDKDEGFGFETFQLQELRDFLLQEKQKVTKNCKILQDCLAEAEGDAAALRAELESAKGSFRAPGAEQNWAHLLAMIVWRQWRPQVDWLARLRTVVAGAALQSIKFDVEAKEIAASSYRTAQQMWRWGRLAVLLNQRNILEVYKSALLACAGFRRALTGWTRLVAVISKDQAEREKWVVQAWARLVAMLELVDVRNTRSGQKEEAILQNWPRMAELAMRARKSQSRSGARSLATKKVQVRARWVRFAHRLNALPLQEQASMASDVKVLLKDREARASLALASMQEGMKQAEDKSKTWQILGTWARFAQLLLKAKQISAEKQVELQMATKAQEASRQARSRQLLVRWTTFMLGLCWASDCKEYSSEVAATLGLVKEDSQRKGKSRAMELRWTALCTKLVSEDKASDRLTQVGRLSLAASSKHQEVLSRALRGAAASFALTTSWARLFLALQRDAAEEEHATALANYSATATSKFRNRVRAFAAAATFWSIIPKWIGLVFQLLGESCISERIAGTAGMARTFKARLGDVQGECRASLETATRQSAAAADWARFMLQLMARKMLPRAWASHHREIAEWVAVLRTSIRQDKATEVATELRHRFMREVWARLAMLQLQAREAHEQQASRLQQTRSMKQATSSAMVTIEELRAELQDCKGQLEAERRLAREERWSRMALSILRDLQSAASCGTLKHITSRAASQRRTSNLNLQEVEVQRQEEIDMVTAKAAAEVATLGVQEAAIRRWQLLVLFTSQMQFRLCNQYVLNAVATQQRAAQQIALENSAMRPHLAGLQAEVALAWWARFATYLHLQASAYRTRQTLSDLLTAAQASAKASQTLVRPADHWHRMCELLLRHGTSSVLHLLRDIRQLQSARHAHKSRHVGSLSEAVRAHAAHALTAHQMLLQESKRTLSHVPVVQVDAHNVVPVWAASDKQETAARTIRKKIMQSLGTYLTEFPRVEKHPHKSKGNFQPVDWVQAEQSLQVDDSVRPVAAIVPGTTAGHAALEDFCKRISRYDAHRNDPNDNALSGLSPWLHFGQISAQRCALRVRRIGEIQTATSSEKKSCEAFIEESVVRRELSDNFCFYNVHYDSLEGAAVWAQQTLQDHSKDKREHLYSKEELENAKTHDDLWNAAQLQMVREEPPLHIVAEDAGNEAFKLVQRLCKAEPSIFDYEPLWYWTALCSLTEEQLSPKPKIGSLKPVTALQQKRLLCLFHEPVEEASDAVKKLVKQLGLSTPAVLVEELLQAWILNCFEHSEDPLGYSAYFASSFVNGIWSEGDDGLHILRARRDIAPGDEVCISYLPEDVLLHSAEERKKSLKSTKQFDCTCERCAPVLPDEVGWDPCRGFRCPKCGFEEGKGLQGPLQGTSCRECKAKVSVADAKRLLRAEELLEADLKKLDAAVEERRSIHKDRTPLKLWEHLQNWSKQAGKWSDELRYLDLRTDYQRKAYFPGPSGTLAWTLEHQADRLLEMLGHGSSTKKVDAPQDVRQKLGSRLESGAILKLMFGAHHEYFRAVENKITSSKAFVQKL
eukprot:s2127_g9.t3